MDQRQTVFVGLIVCGLLILPGMSQSSEVIRGNRSLQIEACHLELTNAGRAASFRGTVIFDVKTDAGGKVASRTVLREPSFMRSFVNLHEFECCVDHWELKPATQYTVILTAGTTGSTLREWSYSVAEKDGVSVRIVIPRITRNCNGDGT